MDSTLLEMEHRVQKHNPPKKPYHFLIEERKRMIDKKIRLKNMEWLEYVDTLDEGFIQWSSNLDFEEYQKTWSEMATTRQVGEK